MKLLSYLKFLALFSDIIKSVGCINTLILNKTLINNLLFQVADFPNEKENFNTYMAEVVDVVTMIEDECKLMTWITSSVIVQTYC